MLAYESLKLRDPDLVADYENRLAATTASSENYPQGPLNPELIRAVVERKLQDHEAKKLVLHIRGKPIKVREQGEKVIKFILWSNGFVSAAVSAQPYAALAWSGISLLLPVSWSRTQSVPASVNRKQSCSLTAQRRTKP